MKTVSARVNSLRRLDTSGVTDPTVALRLRLIEHRVAMLRDVLEQDKAATAELTELVDQTRLDAHSAGRHRTTRSGRDHRRGRRHPTLHRGRLRPVQRHGTDPGQLGRGRRRARPTSPLTRRQSTAQRRHPPHRDDPTPLRAPRPPDPRPGPHQWPHPPRSHARPQAQPLQRDLPDHAPRRPTTRGLDMRASSAAPPWWASSPPGPRSSAWWA